VIPLTRAIPERTRGGLRQCAIQIDVYLLTLLYYNCPMPGCRELVGRGQCGWRWPGSTRSPRPYHGHVAGDVGLRMLGSRSQSTVCRG